MGGPRTLIKWVGPTALDYFSLLGPYLLFIMCYISDMKHWLIILMVIYYLHFFTAAILKIGRYGHQRGRRWKKNVMNELLSSIRTWWCVTLIPLDCIWEFLFFDPLIFDDFQKRGRQKFRPHFWEGHGGQIFSLTSQEPKTIKKTSFELHGHGIWDIYPTKYDFSSALLLALEAFISLYKH